MKKILRNSILLLAFFAATNSQAQLRYLDEVFTTVTVDTSVVYGLNRSYLTGFASLDSLRMDVYRPASDTATSRPVIILIHAGSFLPGSLTGFSFADRKENCLVELCTRYAKRGWVAVSMSYRLGWNPSSPDAEVRTSTILNAVYRSMQDAKTCVRYFRDDATNGSNQWGIDPTKFVVGGSNSGAYAALAVGNFNKPAELTISKFLDNLGNPMVDTTLTGNFDGFGGTQNNDNYAGVSSAVNAVLPLGGAIGDTTWVEAGEVPVIAFSGVADPLTPFNTAVVTTASGTSVIEVSGPGDFMPYVESFGNNSGFSPNTFEVGPPNRQNGAATVPIDGLYPFWGQGFEPWNWYNGTNPVFNPSASQAKAFLYIDTIMGYATPRLYKLLFDSNYGEPSGIRNVTGNVEMNVFPNPATSELNVFVNSLQKPISSVRLFDVSGRMVSEVYNIDTYYKTVDVSHLASGTYFITLKLTDGATATQKITVQ